MTEEPDKAFEIFMKFTQACHGQEITDVLCAMGYLETLIACKRPDVETVVEAKKVLEREFACRAEFVAQHFDGFKNSKGMLLREVPPEPRQ